MAKNPALNAKNEQPVKNVRLLWTFLGLHRHRPTMGLIARRATMLTIIILVGLGTYTLRNWVHGTYAGVATYDVQLSVSGDTVSNVINVLSEIKESNTLNQNAINDTSPAQIEKLSPLDKALSLFINNLPADVDNNSIGENAEPIKTTIYLSCRKSIADSIVDQLGAVSTEADVVRSVDRTRMLIDGFMAALALLGLWFSYRIVHWYKFAEFLIAVQNEMAKVSWPKKPELINSSVVVILTMFLFTLVLFVYDLVWQALLTSVGVMPGVTD